jgi:hypothetical protein
MEKVMATIIPESEKIKQSLRWISQERESDKGGNLACLISNAAIRFNLSPLEEDFLYAFFRENERGDFVTGK